MEVRGGGERWRGELEVRKRGGGGEERWAESDPTGGDGVVWGPLWRTAKSSEAWFREQGNINTSSST